MSPRTFGRRRARVDFIEVDALGRNIQLASQALQAAGDISLEGFDGPPPMFNGYCARMCQAYKFLSLDDRSSELATPGAQFRTSKKRSGESHYWIEIGGRVMDLNFGPGEEPDPGFWPYSESRSANGGLGFHEWAENRRYPNRKDSRLIVDAVWASLE